MNKTVSDMIDINGEDTIINKMLRAVLVKKISILMEGFSDDLDDLCDIMEELSEQGFNL